MTVRVIGRAVLVAVLLAALVPVAPAARVHPESEPVVEVPAKPGGLEVATDPGSLDVELDWDDVDGADSYLVRWRPAGPETQLNDGVESESSDAVIAVDGFGQWVVRVQACNDAGCGPPVAERFEVEAADEPAPEPEQDPRLNLNLRLKSIRRAGVSASRWRPTRPIRHHLLAGAQPHPSPASHPCNPPLQRHQPHLAAPTDRAPTDRLFCCFGARRHARAHLQRGGPSGNDANVPHGSVPQYRYRCLGGSASSLSNKQLFTSPDTFR